MKADTLAHEVNDMIKQTKGGHMKWNVEVHTTDGNPVEEKVHVQEDGKEWIVDECFTSFSCEYQRQDFCMITYEIVKTSGDKVKSTNMVFLPPAFQRVFDLNMLVSHAVDMNQNLAIVLHNLWELIWQQHKEENPNIILKITDGK